MHSKKNPKLFRCKRCKKTLATAYGQQKVKLAALGLKQHQNSHTKLYYCFKCRKGFGSSSKLSEHNYVHTREKSHICSVCSEKFAFRSGLLAHFKEVHAEVYQELLQKKGGSYSLQGGRKVNVVPTVLLSKEEVTVKNLAPFLNSKTRPQTGLRLHIQSKHPDLYSPRYRKNDCSNTSNVQHVPTVANSSNVQLQVCSTASEKVSCAECGREFVGRYRLQLLKRHGVVHTKERPYVCKICDNGFGFQSSLYKHIKSVHKISHGQYNNKEKTKSNTVGLRSLAATSKENNSSKSKISTQKVQCQVNSRKHTVKCGPCGQKFATISAKLRHVQKVHIHRKASTQGRISKSPPALTNRVIVANIISKDDGQEDAQAEKCAEGSYLQEDLAATDADLEDAVDVDDQSHPEVVLEFINDPYYRCNMCESFIVEDRRLHHLRTAHNENDEMIFDGCCLWDSSFLGVQATFFYGRQKAAEFSATAAGVASADDNIVTNKRLNGSNCDYDCASNCRAKDIALGIEPNEIFDHSPQASSSTVSLCRRETDDQKFLITCDCCYMVCESQEHLKRHSLEHHVEGFCEFYCSICSFMSPSRRHMFDHGRVEHKSTKVLKRSVPSEKQLKALIALRDNFKIKNICFDLNVFV